MQLGAPLALIGHETPFALSRTLRPGRHNPKPIDERDRSESRSPAGIEEETLAGH